MADILKTKGNEAFKAQNYVEADRLYSSSITLDPQNAVLYSNSSITLIKLRDYERCLQVCDTGLIHNPDKKTRIKLLWRKGIALVELQRPIQAKQCYEEALTLEPTNSMVLKSLEELNGSDSQTKRSHSIQDEKAEKKCKTLENVPIYEVDLLPKEFNESSAQQTISSPSSSKTSAHTLPTTQRPTHASVSAQSLQVDFPQAPTLHQFTTIIKTRSPQTWNYVFQLPIEHLQRLLSSGCIEPSIINFLLDSSTHALEQSSSIENAQRALQILKTLATAPRINLVSTFCNRSKLQQLKLQLQQHIPPAEMDAAFKPWSLFT